VRRPGMRVMEAGVELDARSPSKLMDGTPTFTMSSHSDSSGAGHSGTRRAVAPGRAQRHTAGGRRPARECYRGGDAIVLVGGSDGGCCLTPINSPWLRCEPRTQRQRAESSRRRD
jgi:hypothetical protein